MPDDATTPDATATPTLPPLKPGHKTTEAAITFVVAILAALPSSGLFPVESRVVKVAGLIVAGLAALGYQKQRTQIKMAHAAHARALAVAHVTKQGDLRERV